MLAARWSRTVRGLTACTRRRTARSLAELAGPCLSVHHKRSSLHLQMLLLLLLRWLLRLHDAPDVLLELGRAANVFAVIRRSQIHHERLRGAALKSVGHEGLRGQQH